MDQPNKTIFYEKHIKLAAKMTEFGGWSMPLQYPGGIVQEHLATRKHAGLFDVSHMGRFVFAGQGALVFLQHVLSNNAAALDIGQSQYTIIPDDQGMAIDDAYLYRFFGDQYLLVVNAANREKDWNYFDAAIKHFEQVDIADQTNQLAMLSLQGPLSRDILAGMIDSGSLPEPARNRLSITTINGAQVMIGRTGYTGEPLCFELFIRNEHALAIWDLIIDRGAEPVGLGARDTLRLEAALPLYGHEFGPDPQGKEIPIFSCPLAKYAVSFSPLKGDFIGKAALERQFAALQGIMNRDFSLAQDLPQMIMPAALLDRGIARAGNKVFADNKHIGYVTSGTMVPYWKTQGQGLSTRLLDQHAMRAICLVLLDCRLGEKDQIDIEIRGVKTRAVVVPYHLRSEAPPHARPILVKDIEKPAAADHVDKTIASKVHYLLDKAIDNHTWRQDQCINLIPSEQTASSMVHLACVLDPAGRYGEHKQIKALHDADVAFYQGTDFIMEVERLVQQQLRQYLGCSQVETRPISGQMANTVVFSAMTDYLNRANRKNEPRRIRQVLNNHIIKGGHLSAQPMGSLRDFVARDPNTERPAVVSFPVLPDNPYKIDVQACRDVVARYKPQLIILGKSVVLHPEPVAEIRSLVQEFCPDSVIMYDMAHVLGLVGPHFQQPFKEGADIVTGSTHKTFFGTQRGIVAADYPENQVQYQLWEAIVRRTFPGSLSNHHLGTLLGLLVAAYEMNQFKDQYQKNVLTNAKAFALALSQCGLDVAGDPQVSFTETHQVVVKVGYGKGPEAAAKLEQNNIIVNYQACPQDEGFTVAGGIRMGVAEMTRFGMGQEDFKTLAQLLCDVLTRDKNVKPEVIALRKRFTDMKYCFSDKQFADVMEKIHHLV